MQIPVAQELLAAGAQGASERPAARSARLARLGWPDALLADDTPGTRNARLLELRRALFGRAWACVADCPACGMLLDVELDVALLLASGSEATAASVELDWNGERLRFRVPTVADADAASAAADGDEQGATRLARRCLERGAWPAQASERLLERLSRELEALDPLGHLALELTCPGCAATSAPLIDPGALLWQELVEHGSRLVGEVHLLARAYGWSEPEILGLPAERRRQYLELVSA